MRIYGAASTADIRERSFPPVHRCPRGCWVHSCACNPDCWKRTASCSCSWKAFAEMTTAWFSSSASLYKEEGAAAVRSWKLGSLAATPGFSPRAYEGELLLLNDFGSSYQTWISRGRFTYSCLVATVGITMSHTSSEAGVTRGFKAYRGEPRPVNAGKRDKRKPNSSILLVPSLVYYNIPGIHIHFFSAFRHVQL